MFSELINVAKITKKEGPSFQGSLSKSIVTRRFIFLYLNLPDSRESTANG
jgi:hypothetical protein